MSCYFTVILEDASTCALPSEMDLKNEGLIFGRNLPTATMLLQGLAEELGIIPLRTFTRDEEYYEDEDEDEEVNIEWHDPRQGLDTVQKLFSYLLAHPEVDKSPEGAWWILWDLRAVELILREALQKNTRFYFKEM